MGVPISGSYEDAEVTAAMNHIVDGLVEQVETRLGETSLDHVTSAMIFLLLKTGLMKHTCKVCQILLLVTVLHSCIPILIWKPVLLEHCSPILNNSDINVSQILQEWFALKEHV